VRAADTAARSGDDDDATVDYSHFPPILFRLLYLIALALVVAR